MTDISPEEREILQQLAREGEQSPGELAFALDVDLGTIHELVGELRDRGLIERQGFNACRLTAGGHEQIREEE
jgi:DNA-binding MarR family transcriptional regulator